MDNDTMAVIVYDLDRSIATTLHLRRLSAFRNTASIRRRATYGPSAVSSPLTLTILRHIVLYGQDTRHKRHLLALDSRRQQPCSRAKESSRLYPETLSLFLRHIYLFPPLTLKKCNRLRKSTAVLHLYRVVRTQIGLWIART